MPQQNRTAPAVQDAGSEKLPRSQRLETSLLCRFRYQKRNHPCHLLDISEKGLFVESLVLPPTGTEVTVTPSFLEANEGARFRISGVVKHTGRYLASDRNMTGFGLEIRRADRSALRRLKALMEQSPGPAETKLGMM